MGFAGTGGGKDCSREVAEKESLARLEESGCLRLQID